MPHPPEEAPNRASESRRAQRRGHIALATRKGKTFHDRCFPTPASPVKMGCSADAGQDVDDLPYFLVSAEDRIDLTRRGLAVTSTVN